MASSSGGRDCFTILPNEMLGAIASNLDSKDALKLRAVLRKDQEEVLVDIFKDVFRKVPLYVFAVEFSLQRFQSICSHPFFSRVIRRVVFIAGAFVLRPQRDDRGPEDRAPSTFNEFCEVYSKYCLDEDREFGATQESFRLYRRFMSEDIDVSSHDSSDDEREAYISTSAVLTLQSGLSRLALLEEVSISRCVRSEGYNISLLHADGAYVHGKTASGHPSHQRYRDVATARMVSYFYCYHFERIGAFFMALSKSQVQPKTFKIGAAPDEQFRPSAKPFDPENPNHNGALDFLGAIKDLTIAHDHWLYYLESESNFLWPRIAQSATNLQALTLLLPIGPSEEFWAFDNEIGSTLLDPFLQVNVSPQLRRLVIEAPPEFPGLVQARTLKDFLTHHVQLREIRIKNVIPASYRLDGRRASSRLLDDDEIEERLRQPFIDLLATAASQLKELKRCEVLVPFRKCNGTACVIFGDSSENHCLEFCERYALAQGLMCERESFVNLAASLEVQLKEDQWDFGEYVMAHSSSANLHCQQ